MTVWASVAANCCAAADGLPISTAAATNIASNRSPASASRSGHQRRLDTSAITATP
jgi:hypothetical protein